MTLFVLFALTANRVGLSVDAWAASVQAWRLGETGSPWLDSIRGAEIVQSQFLAEAPNGHVVAHRMAGPILLGFPFYLVMQVGHEPGEFTLLPAAIGAAAATAGTVVLMYLALLRATGSRQVASWVSVAFAVATPTWSVSADGLWTHTVTQLGLAGAACATARERLWWAGAALGVAMLGRPHVAVIAAVLGLGLGMMQRSMSPLVKIGLPTVTALGVLSMWNRWMFGEFSIGGAYTGSVGAAVSSSQDPWVNYLGFFLSPDRGLLIWTPVLLLLLPATVRAWGGAPAWAKALAVGGFVYTFVQLRLNYFAGGSAFYSYRHGLELLTCLIPVIGVAVRHLRPAGQVFATVLVGIQFAAISLGAATENFWLELEDVWSDNSYWLALRTQPALTVPWTIFSVAVAVLIWYRSRPSAVELGVSEGVPRASA